MKTLDHKQYENKDIRDVAKDLDKLCVELDQKHRVQRKIQFFLDIRGYFIINKISGNYVEFGVYRGEMMYSAWKVLEATKHITAYIGLDTFTGEPEPSKEERAANPFVTANDYSNSKEKTDKFLRPFLGSKLKLIEGDFRNDDVLKQIHDPNNKIAIASIDCNLLSSIQKSVEYALPNMVPGGVLFLDDFFINMKNGTCEVQKIVENESKKLGLRLLDYKTYPPTAKAYILTR